jgi:thioredoxin-dependent peroxiredoxin
MKSSRQKVVIGALVGLAVLGISLFVGIVVAGDTPAAPAVGTMAPDFKLNSQEGTPVNLSDFRGKWVVLYFYPKDFTPGCTIEAHGFQRDLAQYQAKNVEIVGVSVDSADSHKDFCAKEGLNFKLLSDADHQVVKTYGSVKTMGTNEIAARNTFIVDPKGKIVKVFLGVAPAKHSAEVLAALDDLQKGSAN